MILLSAMLLVADVGGHETGTVLQTSSAPAVGKNCPILLTVEEVNASCISFYFFYPLVFEQYPSFGFVR